MGNKDFLGLDFKHEISVSPPDWAQITSSRKSL